MHRPFCEGPPEGITYVTCADGYAWSAQRAQCLAGISIDLPAEVVERCLDGPPLARAEAIGSLTAGQFLLLFPKSCGCTRLGTNHAKHAQNLSRAWRQIDPWLLSDQEARATLERLPERRLIAMAGLGGAMPDRRRTAQTAALAAAHLRPARAPRRSAA